MAPLSRLAVRTGVAIIVLRHLTKGSSTNAIYRGGGSIGSIGAAHSGWLVAKDPDDPEHVRVLASSKSNLGPPMPSLRYHLIAARAGAESPPRIEWLGECKQSASMLLMTANSSEDGSVLEDALDFLREALAGGNALRRSLTRERLPSAFRRAH